MAASGVGAGVGTRRTELVGAARKERCECERVKAFGEREHGLDWKWNWITVSIKKKMLLLLSSDDYEV